MSKTSRVAVTVRRKFKASAERVFDAWLDPEKAGKFLFTETSQYVRYAEIDPRVGGSFRFVVRREGEDIDHLGEYLEIERPHRLVFDFIVPSFWPEKSRVAIDIIPLESGCELTLTHEGLAPEHESAVFNGWTTFLEGLQTTQFDPES